MALSAAQKTALQDVITAVTAVGAAFTKSLNEITGNDAKLTAAATGLRSLSETYCLCKPDEKSPDTKFVVTTTSAS